MHEPYPLKTIKKLLRSGDYEIRPNAISLADAHFGWEPKDIVRCLLKLNGRVHKKDRYKNHYVKTEVHTNFAPTTMDYYIALNIMDGCDVYTHFYISPKNNKLIISSFHKPDNK